MGLLLGENSLILWKNIVKQAEDRCSITLKAEIESYLISLLMRYTNKPEMVKQVIATAYLEAVSAPKKQRGALQDVGDQCLIFAGLFPRAAERRLVNLNYFVGLGQGAYATISQCTNDLYSCLALQFVILMDVLQSIRQGHDLLPLEAYDQWNELGSQRGLRILQEYTKNLPVKNLKN